MSVSAGRVYQPLVTWSPAPMLEQMYQPAHLSRQAKTAKVYLGINAYLLTIAKRMILERSPSKAQERSTLMLP